jgi:hypothetical protein
MFICCCRLQLKVWRNGQHVELPVQLSTPHQLVPVHSHDLKPHYFIYGGESLSLVILLVMDAAYSVVALSLA